MERLIIPGTQVIVRACDIMRCFDPKNPELSLAEIVQMTGFQPPTAHRILKALTSQGLILQDVSTSRYRLGYTLVKLGELAKKSNDLIQVAQRHVHELAKQWGEATVIDVPDHNLFMDSVLIVPSTYRLSTSVSYDRPLWPHTTAAGKSVLAFLAEDRLEKFLRQELPSYTSFTITDPELLRVELAQVAERGYATNYEEQELGLVAVGAPIFDHTQRVIAALSIGGPSARMLNGNFEKIIQSVVNTAEVISFELGYEN